MTPAITLLIDASYALAVVGVALTPWPWVALIVAAVYMLGQAVLMDRRTPPPEADRRTPPPEAT